MYKGKKALLDDGSASGISKQFTQNSLKQRSKRAENLGVHLLLILVLGTHGNGVSVASNTSVLVA